MRQPFRFLLVAWISAVPVWAASDPRWAARLDDADLAVAGEAAAELGQQGVMAFPAIRELLASGSAQQRWGATVALFRSTADPGPFLPELTRQLSDADERLVQASLGALARLQAGAASALPEMASLLTHEEPDIRLAALAAIAAVGPAARDSLPEVQPLLQDDSAEVRLAAAEAMRRVHPPAPRSAGELAAYVAWLEREVPLLMRELHVPGVSIAVMQRGEVVWARGYGVRDARTPDLVTTDTVFEAASMSKPVFALVAMQLAQEGHLDLDRPLVEYLGHDYLSGQPEHRRITARRLRGDGRAVDARVRTRVRIHLLG